VGGWGRLSSIPEVCADLFNVDRHRSALTSPSRLPLRDPEPFLDRTLLSSATVSTVGGLAVLRIQIWAPGLDVAWLVDGLEQTRLKPLLLVDPAKASPNHPLLIAYADPLGRLAALAPQDAAEHDAAIPVTLARLELSGCRCRLVNLSCVSLPALVAWCLEAGVAQPAEAHARFAKPDPFEALLAIAWLEAQPEPLQAYQALESHPLAAALDGRPPDLDCLGRYQQAANLDALLAARQERAALEHDLAELAEQLAPLQEHQLEALALREQVALLQARLQQADVLEDRCSELQLSLQAQQLDLEQLARRLALLEQLVGAGCEASLRLQGRLAQAMA